MLAWMALPVVLALDSQNAFARWRRNVVSVTGEGPTCNDYTLCLTIYGSADYFKNREWAAQRKDRVLVILHELDDFADELEADGFRVFRAQLDRKPAPPELILAAIEAGQITTKYCVRMDADVTTDGDIDRAIGAMDDAGAEACSVKCHVANRHASVLTEFQGVEYECAMLARHNRPWCFSGAFFVVRTDLLLTIYRNHSLWFYGEDSETGMVARRFKMRVKHLDLTVVTEVPETLGAWFKQRRGWWAGSFRQTWVNADHMVRYPLWMVYNAFFVWVGLTFRWDGLVHVPLYLPAILILYTAVTIAANWQVRSEWMLVYTFYALAQVIAMPAVGAVYYAHLAIKHRRAGRYRFPTFGVC